MLSATTIVRIRRALPCLARRAEHDYPDARYDYPDARYQQLLSSPPRLCRGQKKPAPNAEAPEAGHGPKAARIKQLANHETNLHEHRHKEGEAAKQGQVAEHRCPAYQPLPKNNAHKSSGFQYT